MALSVVITVTFSGTQVIVTDTTGAYNVSSNPGGYGAPNAAFSDYAHYVILRKKNVNLVADVVLVLDAYNPLSSTVFTYERSLDGWYEATKLNILKWTAGSYVLNDVRYYNGTIYKANTATSSTPGADGTWTVVTDLTTIESNATLIATVLGRSTAYNADTYWSKQIALLSQKGQCGICDNDKHKNRLDKIYFHIQAELVADQFGNNEDAEWNVQALILLGADLEGIAAMDNA